MSILDSDEVIESIECDEMAGFCIKCGERSESLCEPDARKYRCDSCGEMEVYGAEELILMGLVG